MPIGFSSSSSMIALYMPMQPSSKTPMIALSRSSWSARARPRSACGPAGSAGESVTWAASCSIAPVSSHCRIPSRNHWSVKSTLQIVE